MLNAEEIEETLRGGYELRGVEVKGPGHRTDAHLFAKVARAALSMGNLRDGGHVVLGVDDNDIAALRPGLSDAELESWLAYDDVARKLAMYADPPLRFDIASSQLSSGAVVVIVEVHEFSDIPHLCAKEYTGVLRKGALYVRTRRVPETAEVASSVELREILQIASEKTLRSYVETAERAGLRLTRLDAARSRDSEQYEQQRAQAWR